MLYEKAISIITSDKLKEADKVAKIKDILEKNPDILHAQISNSAIKTIGLCNTIGLPHDKITLLHLVAILNYAKVAKLMIEEGANVNVISDDGFKDTPLHKAAFYGNKEVTELLLEYNADIESKDYLGNTPLYNAARAGSEEVVKLLLEKGGNVNGVTSNYSGQRGTPLHKAIANSHIDRYQRIIKMLLDCGANTEIEDRSSGTSLHKAVSAGQVEAIKLLLEAKANVNARNRREGETPLHLVVNGGLRSTSKKACEAAELLLKHGADVNAKDKNGNTPLHMAALERSKGVVKILLKYGANINETNNYGATALKRVACCVELFDSINEEVDPEPTVKFLIKQTLKNNPSIEKPEFMKKMENSSYVMSKEYSEYWDKCQLGT